MILNIGKRKLVSLFVLSLLMTSFGFVQVGLEQPFEWHFKASYEDYAPSGVPDFDQRQSNWTNPATGRWSWCGTLAAANSLWWFDSKFEPNPVAPPTVNDGFPLVTAYGGWDDHDPLNVEPFVNDLAWFMDTDGQRTGLNENGTRVRNMEAGISQYLQMVGLNPPGDANGDGKVDGNDETIVLSAMGSVPGGPNWNMTADLNGDNIIDPLDLDKVMLHLGEASGKFYEKTVKMPTFNYVAEQVEKSEDVVILLGFWQNQSKGWVRLGGHYVTVAGVNSANQTIAFSDPATDNAELGYPGRVIPPPPHPHNSTPPFPLHNNASYVSHDFYASVPSLSPGGVWGPEDYNRSIETIENCIGQNTPEEFEAEAFTGSYNLTLPVYVEVEYAVVVSPTPDAAITNVTPEMTEVPKNYMMDINVTAANQGLSTATLNVTAYCHETEGFESGTFAGWDFYYSTNGAQSGSCPAGTWSSSIVSGASALSGAYSARLFADSDVSADPWRVDAAINRTISRNGASILKAMFKFDQITDPGAAQGHAYFYISVRNALNTSEFITYGFDNSTGLWPGDISSNVSPGDLVNFETDVAADYFNKYGKALPQQVMILLMTSADYGIDRQTIEVRLDDITFISTSTPIGTKAVTLAGGNSTVLTFTWNPTGLNEGSYIISAVADIAPGEADTADNAYIDDAVSLTAPQIIPGDVNGDGTVDDLDLSDLSKVYGCMSGDDDWDERCDFNWDDKVDLLDLFILGKNYGKTI